MRDGEYKTKEEYLVDLYRLDIWTDFIYSPFGLGRSYENILQPKERLIVDMLVDKQPLVDEKVWSNKARDIFVANVMGMRFKTFKSYKSMILTKLKDGFDSRVDDKVRRFNYIKQLKENRMKDKLGVFLGVFVGVLASSTLTFASYDPADHLARFEREAQLVEKERERRHELKMVEKEIEVLGKLKQLGASNISVRSSSSLNQEQEVNVIE